MLVKICAKDGIPLVNIVRSDAQADLLRGIGAKYACNSTAPTFMEDAEIYQLVRRCPK
jgi:NADPH2:quinone reductase